MKKMNILLLIFLLFSVLLCACSKTPETAAETSAGTTASAVSSEAEPATETPTQEAVIPSGKYALSAEGEAIVDDVPAAAASDGKNRVFYEIFVWSFSDSDGDGVGDLRGIINRMDYLNDGDPDSGLSLGVEGIWLTPIFKSPSYHKYNVTDYYTIDPAFGTMDDLKELIELCHERDVKIILDLPINHTGYMNEWFSSFIKSHRDGDTNNEYYDFYCYYSEGDAKPVGRNFAQVSGTNDYYECNFSGDMPELNFDNPLVRERVLEIAKYYLTMGIDGFRFDAAKYIYYGDNAACLEFWTWYMNELRSVKPDIYTVAEVWDADSITQYYSSAVDCFAFSMSQTTGRIYETAQAGNVGLYTSYVADYLDIIQGQREDAVFIPFIANHDTDRAAGFLTVASGQMKIAANLYLLGPGSPFIYYGEEIGLKGSRGGATTDANRRLAMLWGDDDTISDPPEASYGAKNQTNGTVAQLKGQDESLLTYYKRLLMLRRAFPAIASGTYEPVSLTGTKLGGFISELNGQRVLVLHNTSISSAAWDLSEIADGSFTILAASIGVSDASLDGTMLTIGKQTSVILIPEE